MQTLIHKAEDRGYADHGWLKSYHSFSFAHYYDPVKMGFGQLRVINDDHIEPARGFSMHPHDNMEIISIPLSGSLAHKDSMGHQYTIASGEVQVMSAGTGVSHSEYNESTSKPVELLQIWVVPKQKNVEPRYEQKAFSSIDRQKKWQLLVSPGGRDQSLYINQDAFFSRSNLASQDSIEYKKHLPTNGVYIFLISGEIRIGNTILQARDALGIQDTQQFTIVASKDADILAIEVPMK
tara:strand:+ start:7596 stop:8306 length:711 start_codon:yes stop_codon:yes gene_type:complete